MNNEAGYSISYPSGWEVIQTDFEILILHPTGTEVSIAFEATQGVTLEEFAAVDLDDYLFAFAAEGFGAFEEESRTRIDNPEGLLIRGRMAPNEEFAGLVLTIIYTLHAENTVSVFMTVRDSLFQLHQPILERILASMKFFTPPPPPADDHGDSPGTATQIEIGDSAVGVIVDPFDLDYFSFSGVAGQTYQAQVELNTLENAILTLESDGGTCIVTGSIDYNDTGAPLIRWRFDVDGTYHLLVENEDALSTGSYTLRLTMTTDTPTDDHGSDLCAATAIDVGDDVTGIIEEPVDFDSFSFQAEAGKTYTVVVTLGTLEDSLLTLWDTDEATELAFNDDFGATLASRIRWTAPLDGTYFLNVENADFVSIGTYTLRITSES